MGKNKRLDLNNIVKNHHMLTRLGAIFGAWILVTGLMKMNRGTEHLTLA